MDPVTQQLIAQLGAAGIFAAATVVIAKAFYQHYEDEIKYLRGRIDCLEEKLSQVSAKLRE